MKNRIEDGKSTQAVTLFAPVGVAEDLSKIQYTPVWINKRRAEVIEAIHC